MWFMLFMVSFAAAARPIVVRPSSFSNSNGNGNARITNAICTKQVVCTNVSSYNITDNNVTCTMWETVNV